MSKATPDQHGDPREPRDTHARTTLWRRGTHPHMEVSS